MLSGMSPHVSPGGTALVTGATAGIGAAFADELGRRGHDLVLVARDPARLEDAALRLHTAHGVVVETISADLTDRAQLATVEARLAESDRPVDLLVNNAGFGLKGKFLDNSVEQEQAHLDVHVVAPMRLLHATLGGMVARGRGDVVNVASVSAFLPRGSYGAAKAYTVKLSEWAHHEYAGSGVRVMALCPGFVRTEFHQRMDVGRDSAPPYLWLDVDTVVREALADLEKGKAVSIPSLRFKLIANSARLLPSSVLQRFQAIGRK